MATWHGNKTLWLPAFLSLAMGLRFLWAVGAPTWDPKLRQSERWGDAEAYHLLAESILRGEGLSLDGQPTAFRPPGYPVFLSLLYRSFGSSPLLVRFIQGLLGSLTCYLTFLLAQRWYEDRNKQEIALLALAMTTVHPLLIYTGGWIYGETLASLLVLASLVASTNHRIHAAIAAGLCAGAAILTRPPLCLLALGLGLQFFLLCSGRIRSRLMRSALVLGTAGCLLAPWTMRNRVHWGEWILFTTSSGANLMGGNNPEADGGFVYWKAHPGQTSPYLVDGMTEPESDAWLRAAAWSLMKEDPLRILLRIPRKWIRLLSPSDYGTSDPLPGGLGTILWIGQAVFLGLSFLGLCLGVSLWRRQQGPLFLLLGILLFSALFFGSPRFLVPAIPVLCVYAARGAHHLWDMTGFLHRSRS